MGEQVDERPDHPEKSLNLEKKAELEADIKIDIKSAYKSKSASKIQEIKYNEYMKMLQSKFYPCEEGCEGDCQDKSWKDFKKKMEEMTKGFRKSLYYDLVKKRLENSIEERKNGIANLRGLVDKYGNLAKNEQDEWVKTSYEGL